MSFIDNINQLFRRESVPSTTTTNRGRLFKSKRFELKEVDYRTGCLILEDTQVSTGFDILKYLLSSKSWLLVKNNLDESGVVYDFILNTLSDLDTELNDIVKSMTTAILWGFSVHELIFDVNNDGKVIIKDCLPVHMKTLQNQPFIYDDDGVLVEIHQQWENEDVYIPISKALVYSFNAKYDEDKGHGVLEDFKPIIEDKLNINQWLMNYLEKHEAPTLYGKTDNFNRDNLLDAFDNVSEGTTGIVVGMEDEVGVLESSHRGETFFNALQFKDNQIFRRMFIGNLLLGDNSQTGTYAQSQSQLEFGKLVFDGILEEIANSIQKQIINPLVEYNYGDKRLAPVISFDKFQTGDYQNLFATLKPLIDNGTIHSENSAIQESISQYIKSETGLVYENTNEPIIENYQLPPDNTDLTERILDDLNA